MLNKNKSIFLPLKIVKPTQSGFAVNDKSSWDVIKKKTPVTLKMNERNIHVWSVLLSWDIFHQTYDMKLDL